MGTWGYTGTGTNQASRLSIDYSNVCDQFTLAGQQLDSMHFWSGDAGYTARIALYSATNPSDFTTAYLVEDLGEFTTSVGWNTINSATNPTIPQNEYPILCVKDNTTGTHFAQESGAQEQVNNLVWNHITNDASDVPFQATMDSGTSSSGSSISLYLTYSAAGGGGVGAAAHYYAQLQ